MHISFDVIILNDRLDYLKLQLIINICYVMIVLSTNACEMWMVHSYLQHNGQNFGNISTT